MKSSYHLFTTLSRSGEDTHTEFICIELINFPQGLQKTPAYIPTMFLFSLS